MNTLPTIWIVTKDNKILRSIEAKDKESVEKSLLFFSITDYDEIINTKQNNSIIKGKDIREYNDNYELKPDLDRIIGGFIEPPEGKKLNEDKTALIDKTIKEKIDDEEIKLSEYQKYDEETETIRNKKLSELYKDNLLKLEDYINNYIRPSRKAKIDEVDLVYCNALNLIKMTDSKKKEWEIYKQALRDLPETITTVIDEIETLFPSMPN